VNAGAEYLGRLTKSVEVPVEFDEAYKTEYLLTLWKEVSRNWNF